MPDPGREMERRPAGLDVESARTLRQALRAVLGASRGPRESREAEPLLEGADSDLP